MATDSDRAVLLAWLARVSGEYRRMPSVIAAALDAGAAPEEVAAAAGVHRSTVWRWERRARRRAGGRTDG